MGSNTTDFLPQICTDVIPAFEPGSMDSGSSSGMTVAIEFTFRADPPLNFVLWFYLPVYFRGKRMVDF